MLTLSKSPELHSDLERELCEILQRYLHILRVDPSENFLALGGDSLTILGFLMEVTTLTKTSIPLQALIGISTIRDLVQLLSTGVSVAQVTNVPDIRPLEPRDRAEVTLLLDEGHRTGFQWDRIFYHPWQPDNLPRGFVLKVSGAIVGFIGLIGAVRTLNGKSGLVCNLTSWYVRQQHRGSSNALLVAATHYDATYTALTPAPVTQRVLRALGFVPFDSGKRFLLPLGDATTLRGPRPSMIFDPVAMRPFLSAEHRRLLDDHIGYPCLPMALIDLDGRTVFMMFGHRRYYRGIVPYSQVFYCSARDVLIRHLEWVKLAVMRVQRTVGLLVSEQQSPPGGLRVSSHTLFRSSVFGADELDRLYL